MALGLVASVMALLIGELVVRAVGAVPPVRPMWVSLEKCVYKRSDNPLLSIELKENFRDPDPDFIHTYEHTNTHGLRDKERSIPKPNGIRRIILLGDSVVEGFGIGQSQTMSHQWEVLYPAGKTEVLNFGVSGYVTRAEVELLEVKGLAFDPDVVVLVFVENDFDNFIAEALPLAAQADRPNWSKHLFVHCHLFRLVAIRFNLYGFGIDADPLHRNRTAIGDNNVVDGIARFRELAMEHGFDPLIAIWPKFENTGIADLFPMPGGGNDLVIERLARMHNIPSVRLSHYFVEHHDRFGIRNPRLAYSTGDGMHPSPTGCAVAATALEQIIAERLKQLDAAGGDRWARAVQIDPPAVAAAAVLGTGEPNYARVYVNEGKALLDEGRIEEAIEKFNEAIELNPQLDEAFINRGSAHRQLGRYDLALADFAKAIELEPDSALGYNNRGHVYRLLGKDEPALAAFDRAIELKPDYPEAYNNRGHIHAVLGRYDPALADFTRAIELKPDFARAYYNRASVYRHLRRYDPALADLGKSIDLEPTDADAWYQRANLYRQMRRYDPALADYARAIELNPDYAEAYNNRGAVRGQLGRYEPALADFNRAIELKPDYPNAYNNRGTLYRQMGKEELAEADFKRAAELKPD